MPDSILSNSPKNKDLGSTNVDTTPRTAERYASTDAMAAEFGSYRVNNNTDKLCNTSGPYTNSDDMAVLFPPLT